MSVGVGDVVANKLILNAGFAFLSYFANMKSMKRECAQGKTEVKRR